MNTHATLERYLSDPRRQLEQQIHYSTWSVFFESKPEFVRWMVEFVKERKVVDCGCGLGNTTAVLRQAGLHTMGIDLYPSDNALIDDIAPINSALFPYNNDMVALLCRPCRGDWIHATIIKAIEGGSPVVYVGKESHYEADIQPLPYHVEIIMHDAGVAGETAWLITKNDK